jgi:pyrimidine deaminase RibD-like protein
MKKYIHPIGQKTATTTYPTMVGSVIVYENRIIGRLA